MMKLADENLKKANYLLGLAASQSRGDELRLNRITWENGASAFITKSVIPFVDGIKLFFRDKEKYKNVRGVIKYLPLSKEDQRAFICRKEGDEGYVNFICRLIEYTRLVRLLKYYLKIALWY
jgi:hypothetical protein